MEELEKDPRIANHDPHFTLDENANVVLVAGPKSYYAETVAEALNEVTRAYSEDHHAIAADPDAAAETAQQDDAVSTEAQNETFELEVRALRVAVLDLRARKSERTITVSGETLRRTIEWVEEASRNTDDPDRQRRAQELLEHFETQIKNMGLVLAWWTNRGDRNFED